MNSPSTWDAALQATHEHARSAKGRAPWRVQGLRAGARAFFIARYLLRYPSPALVVLPDPKSAERFTADLRFFLGESGRQSPFERRAHYLPGWDVPPFDALSPSADTVAARIEGLYHLRQSRNPIIVSTGAALLQKVPPLTEFGTRYLYLVEGDAIDRDDLARKLTQWGYRRVGLVEDRSDFCVRGGIVDVFPPAHPLPLRIQLDGDTIEAIHEFDPVSQRLAAQPGELLVLPAREFDLSRGREREVRRAVEARLLDLEVNRRDRNSMLDGLDAGIPFPGIEFCLPYFFPRLDTVLDYLPAQSLVWIDQPAEVEADLERRWTDIERRAAEHVEDHRFAPVPEHIFTAPAEWRRAVQRRPIIELEPLEVLVRGGERMRVTLRSFALTDLRVKRTHRRKEMTFAPIAEQVQSWRAAGQQVYFVAGGEAQRNRITRLLETHRVVVDTPAEEFRVLLQNPTPRPRVLLGELGEGFRLPDEHLVIATEKDLFGETRRRATGRVSVSQLLKNLSELKPEDYVVHLDHGVGLYRGLRHLHVAGTEGDYLHLKYAGGDRLYVPADRISLVQKFVGADGTSPSLDKLGGASWARVKRKTRESILAMARELLGIYAAREIHERPSGSPPDEFFREFEAAFPFEETPDQKQAIADVTEDLQRPRPMDRLICGDVGYGKTEVAMRAAFLTVMDGRQVALLVPTTILAYQHLGSFRARFDGYPIHIEMLSRLHRPSENRDVIAGVGDGTVDVVIGTHRMLQRDVKFKRLGLLVIDEEHRFGVRHKERIKQMRKLVDVLTLTATPIPRTLQMSLLDIRDLSVIETPPVDRLAIRTYVTRYDDDVIREAILRELGRRGQVFFVHNRVANIDVMAGHLRQLVPEARIAVAHGQMQERDLERVMLGFVDHDTDVLVCSAIIEAGLDIPNANTILINRADHFGLAQLYQLRGRVGRSYERAYAYLLIPGAHVISRDAQKRLQVLQELDDLGGGFRLAAHDLEIRGAGNLLGKQQSGQVAAVGFELYTQMLEEAVQELKGHEAPIEVEPEIQLGFPAYLPDEYIVDENQRLAFYRRLTTVETSHELDEITTELRERYGPIPPLVDSLLRVMDLRRTLKALCVLRATAGAGAVTLRFHPQAPVDTERIGALVQRDPHRFRLSADFQLSIQTEAEDPGGLVQEVRSVLETLRQTSRRPEGRASASRG